MTDKHNKHLMWAATILSDLLTPDRIPAGSPAALRLSRIDLAVSCAVSHVENLICLRGYTRAALAVIDSMMTIDVPTSCRLLLRRLKACLQLAGQDELTYDTRTVVDTLVEDMGRGEAEARTRARAPDFMRGLMGVDHG
jgi:hypothetical protein